MTAKFDFETFTRKNDFSLWRMKMKALLVQQGLLGTLKGEFLATIFEYSKQELLDRAHSSLTLALGDQVLREVGKEQTAAAMWAKLDKLYLTKSLASRLYAKKRLYAFKITEDRSICDQIDAFNKVRDDLQKS